MHKIIVLSLLLVIAFQSCKLSKKEFSKVELAKQYFGTLDNADYSDMSNWFADSLTTIEGDYKQTYAQSEYLAFLKWDSVFEPTYEILGIEEKDGLVNAKISKMDKRIAFLHEEPFITNQTLKFREDKIISIDIEYVEFKVAIWEKNKNKLLSWIDENHPELNGYIYDQTEAGGKKFLESIELYQNKE